LAQTAIGFCPYRSKKKKPRAAPRESCQAIAQNQRRAFVCDIGWISDSFHNYNSTTSSVACKRNLLKFQAAGRRVISDLASNRFEKAAGTPTEGLWFQLRRPNAHYQANYAAFSPTGQDIENSAENSLAKRRRASAGSCYSKEDPQKYI
jgi:hypothetical protein